MKSLSLYIPLTGRYFLVVVDAFSKWVEALPVTSPSASATIAALRQVFAAQGLPDIIVSDNGPAFASAEYQDWLQKNGIRRMLVPPYHPASNGATERVVQTIKDKLKKSQPGDFRTQVARVLFQYRTTPHEVTGRAPCELLLGRMVKTSLDVLHPDLRSTALLKQLKQKLAADRGCRPGPLPEPGASVYARNFRPGPPWSAGHVVSPASASSLLVRMPDGTTWHRHADHVRSLQLHRVERDRYRQRPAVPHPARRLQCPGGVRGSEGHLTATRRGDLHRRPARTCHDQTELGSRGTPQGAVLSPLLFNLALRGLPEALRAVPNVEHAIYADDITLWCREGSDAEIEEKLQAAADIVGEYVMRCGLKCAPEKSELLVFRNPRDKLVDHIDVVIDGVRVPKPAEVRILGQLLQQGRGNKSTIDRLDAMTTQVCGMMRRIRNRRHGIKEKEAIQLVQAFIIARLTYGTPYLNLNKAEMQKLNVLIRRAYKNALGLPERTATEKLLKLGVHNTIEELHEAQLVSQLKRLSSTVNGAWLLDKLGMAVPGGSHGPGDAGEELPAETRQRFTISRIPRNMHPDRNAERRQARAVALARSWDSREGTLYVDGAGPVLGVAAIAVASAQGQIRRVASIRAQTVEQVEEAAIALAVVCNPRATIISDSQRACQNFARGVVGQPALRLLRKTAVEGVHLIWTPGHMGQVGNEAANAAARGALYRDSVLPQRDLDSALTYSEALKALRTHRAEYPGPAKGLSKEEEFTWRRLQTDTFVTPIQLHLWYPERYATADCPFCGKIEIGR
ncbi:hypothetical protein ISCGN_020140 [Ixodes scapularis]